MSYGGFETFFVIFKAFGNQYAKYKHPPSKYIRSLRLMTYIQILSMFDLGFSIKGHPLDTSTKHRQEVYKYSCFWMISTFYYVKCIHIELICGISTQPEMLINMQS